MGRLIVHFWHTRRMTLALRGAVVMLPLLLCACRHHHGLIGWDDPYHIIPSQIQLDDEPEPSEELRISRVEISMAPEPIRWRDRQTIVHWDMTLQEVIFHALANSQVIRQGGQFLSPNNTLLRSPEGITTVYDQEIQSSGVLFGQRGVQAALSEFDTQFTTRMLWGNSSNIQNSGFNAGGIAPGGTLQEDTAQFQASLQRSLLTGGQVGFSHNWNYTSNNGPGRLLPSAYDGNLKMEFRQPLLAGAGSDYARIAGPISDNIQGVTGVQQGMLIARLNNTLAMADFELSVIGFLRDVELQYWRLHLAYHTYDVEQASQADAQRILDMVEARADAPGGDLARVVEAREGVLQSQQRVIEARDSVDTNESQLRLLMGFSLQTDRMIHPMDVPVTAEVSHDWSSSLGWALARRPELRRQKSAIRSAELQLSAAQNLNRPRLDFLASGQTNGFGDNLLGSRSAPGTTRSLGNAYDRLFRGQETGWNLGVEFSQPLGLRFAGQQVKNNELKLTKARTVLEAQEVEILHEMKAAFQAVDKNYLAMQNQRALVTNAAERLEAAESDYESNKEGRGFLDLDSLNRARDIYAQAVVQWGQAQIEYSISLTDIELRSGRLLDHHNVILSAGPQHAMSAPFVSTPEPQPILPPPMDPQVDPTPPAETPAADDASLQTETEAIVEYESPDESEEQSLPAWAADTTSEAETILDGESGTDEVSQYESGAIPDAETLPESDSAWPVDPRDEFPLITPVDFESEDPSSTGDESTIKVRIPEDAER